MSRFQLIVREPGAAPRTVPLETTLSVGRSKRCDVVVADEEVGREQFRIGLEGDGVCLDNLGQTNKTWVNGMAVAPGSKTTLAAGAIVRVGKTQFEILGEDDRTMVYRPGRAEPAAPPQPTMPERAPPRAPLPAVENTIAAPGPLRPGAAPADQEGTGSGVLPMRTQEFAAPRAAGADSPAPAPAPAPAAPPPAAAADTPGADELADGPMMTQVVRGFRPGQRPLETTAPPPVAPPAPPPAPQAPAPDEPMMTQAMPRYRPGAPIGEETDSLRSPPGARPAPRPAPPAAAPPPPPKAEPPRPAPAPPAPPPSPVAAPAPAPAHAAAPAPPRDTVYLGPIADLAAPGSTDRLDPQQLDAMSRVETLAARLVLKGEGLKRRVKLQSPSLQVGRADGAGVEVPDDSVSEQHAEFQLGPAGWRLRDLGSTNGTLVDGAAVDAAGRDLRRNALVQFGRVRALFLCEEPGAGGRLARREERAAKLLMRAGRVGREEGREAIRLARADRSQSVGELLLMDTPLQPAEWTAAVAAAGDGGVLGAVLAAIASLWPRRRKDAVPR